MNLYPFEKTIAKDNVNEEDAIENIDIGGPTMIRSAAKNIGWTCVVIDPNDYSIITDELEQKNHISYNTRKKLSAKAFGHTAQYDTLIHNYFKGDQLSNNLTLTFKKHSNLRYGENPHQNAFVLKERHDSFGLPQAKQVQGKEMSYNNFLDGDAALLCLHEFKKPSCVIVKHGSPCGVGTGKTSKEAFLRALKVDPLSAFGGVVAINKRCDLSTAKELNKTFFEIIVAPSFDGAALSLFSKKKNLRILVLPRYRPKKSFGKEIAGGWVIQETDLSRLKERDLKTVTKKHPTKTELSTLFLAWKTVKHTKSNAIVVAHNKKIISISGGQTSRVDAVRYALTKNKVPVGAVVASDAFFPFRDSIDLMGKHKIKAVIQPGGSIKDQDIIEACNEHKISMVFTGTRVFKH